MNKNKGKKKEIIKIELEYSVGNFNSYPWKKILWILKLNSYKRKTPFWLKRFGSSIVKSVSVLSGICYCGFVYMIQYPICVYPMCIL